MRVCVSIVSICNSLFASFISLFLRHPFSASRPCDLLLTLCLKLLSTIRVAYVPEQTEPPYCLVDIIPFQRKNARCSFSL